MPRRHHVLARLVPLLQRCNAQMTGNISHARLPRFMAVPSTSRQTPWESTSRRVNQPETVSDAVHQGDIHWNTSFWPNVDGRVKRLASETNPQTLGSGFSVFAPPSCTSSMC